MKLPAFRLPRRPAAAARDVLGHNGRENLHFPLPISARLAVIDTDFIPGANMKAFGSSDIRGLEDYAPDALALPLSTAMSLADRKLRGQLELRDLKSVIIVFSSLDSSDSPPLEAHHRDLLWKAFGLPVFEQLRGWDGRIIARECEVHDGLHFDPKSVTAEIDDEVLLVKGKRTGFAAEIVREHCECGVETPRLRSLAGARVRAAAAA